VTDRCAAMFHPAGTFGWRPAAARIRTVPQEPGHQGRAGRHRPHGWL